MENENKRNDIRQHIVFSGRVQGVGFRYRAYYIAQSLGLTGWVKNTWDDKVEMEVQGIKEAIQRMILLLHEQNYICIEEMHSNEIPLQQETGFHIR
ncbi:MAG: acylphosphatase [Lachnospiraceae bacterium]|nr:acylphosphatase [Robinsoniella sp.]MDY3766968.1 acylphosphatase [Lachnospiraceae bacterium]